jgi:flagellar hook-associated protein 3 FlgL
MALTSIGDLAQTFLMRRQNARLQQDMTRLTRELASGQATDPVRHLSGDTGRLSRLDHGLALNSGYQSAAREAATFATAMQSAFERIQGGGRDLESALRSIDNSNLVSVRASASRMAEQELQNAIGALNTSVAGRAVFAGHATDTTAVAPAGTMLAALRDDLAGATSVAEVTARMDAWFNAPSGGFETSGYSGGDAPLSPFRVGPGQSVAIAHKADSAEIRDHLMALSMAALADDAALPLPDDQRAAMLDQAAQRLTRGRDALIRLRADLGETQAQIDAGTARLSSERAVLDQARSELLAVDPYETATELENLQFRLESLYSLTVRLSRLSLSEFMK